MGQPRIGNVLDLPATEVVEALPVVENILAVFAQATVAELDEGLSWYDDAHSLAKRLDPANPSQAAGVLAALSPMMPWGRNVQLAVRAYEDGEATGALKGSLAKANRILAGESADVVLGGDKVRSFWKVIADPTDTGVVIDRHAFDIAVGCVTNNASRGALTRKGVYARFCAAYNEAAETLGYSPSQVQAVTWTVWRRLKGLDALK